MTEDGVNGIMGSKARVRLLSDTGSTTGVATVILALLSAGTVATITLVGAHQLALMLRAVASSAMNRPRSASRRKSSSHPARPVPPSSPARAEQPSHRHSAPRSGRRRPIGGRLRAAVVTSPATPPPGTHTPRVTLPRVHVDRPTVTPHGDRPGRGRPTATGPAVTRRPWSARRWPPPAPGLSPGSATVVNAPPVPGYLSNVTSTGPRRASGLDAIPPPQPAGRRSSGWRSHSRGPGRRLTAPSATGLGGLQGWRRAS